MVLNNGKFHKYSGCSKQRNSADIREIPTYVPARTSPVEIMHLSHESGQMGHGRQQDSWDYGRVISLWMWARAKWRTPEDAGHHGVVWGSTRECNGVMKEHYMYMYMCSAELNSIYSKRPRSLLQTTRRQLTRSD